jgi:hypothetical protein
VTAIVCPNCGRLPTYERMGVWPGNTHCRNCYDGAEDSGEVSRLIGYGDAPEQATAEWNDNVSSYVADLHEMQLLRVIAECDGDIDAGHAEPERLRALARLYRDELTARHKDAIETVVDNELGSRVYAGRIGADEAAELVGNSPALSELYRLHDGPGVNPVTTAVIHGVSRRVCGAA